MKTNSDQPLCDLVDAILANDSAAASLMLAAEPQLATASFRQEAAHQAASEICIEAIGRYIVAGDTALHFAAAAYRPEITRTLIAAGASTRARNRFGDEPLHSAARGQPGSKAWNPAAQSATIDCLVAAGADPNAGNKRSVRPLHVAVRTRCAEAARALLRHGADPSARNKSGSTPLLLAGVNSGRSGSGSEEAKAQQREILALLARRESASCRR